MPQSSTDHVRIIPVSRSSKWSHVVLFLAKVVEYVPQTSVRVLNIIIVAPQVAMLGKDSVIGLKNKNAEVANYLF